MAGTLWSMTIVHPMRVPINQSPYHFIYQDWATGFLYTGGWVRFVMLAVFPGSWKQKFEKIWRDGVVGLDFSFALKEIVFPIISYLSLALCVPYVISKGIVPLISTLLVIRLCE